LWVLTSRARISPAHQPVAEIRCCPAGDRQPSRRGSTQATLRNVGTRIPRAALKQSRSTTKRACDFALYCERNLVERFFNKVKPLGQKIEAIEGIVPARRSLVGWYRGPPIFVLGCCELHSQKQAQLKVGAFESQLGPLSRVLRHRQKRLL
jgi:hypothetical protein